jgi:hypothetical protein
MSLDPHLPPQLHVPVRGRLAIVALALSAFTIGCGEDDPPAGPSDAAADDAATDAADAGAASDAAGSCNVTTEDPPEAVGNHVPLCSAIQWASNPPSSGTHYPEWPVFRAYDKPVPWGFLMHGLEHGAVVLAYNCPDGCAADIAAAKQVMQAVPARACGKPPVILTPDPTLSSRFAASAWGHLLRAPCFDRSAFAAFITAHMNQGPELISGDCGIVDKEATGWCP